MKQIVIIGAGGFAREVLDIVEACNAIKNEYEVLGFIVEPGYGRWGDLVNEKPIVGDFEWLSRHKETVFITCAVGAPHHRYRLVKRATSLGCRFCNLIHPSAVVTNRVSIGEGVVIAA